MHICFVAFFFFFFKESTFFILVIFKYFSFLIFLIKFEKTKLKQPNYFTENETQSGWLKSNLSFSCSEDLVF